MSIETQIQTKYSQLWRAEHPERYKKSYTKSNKKYYKLHKTELNSKRKTYRIRAREHPKVERKPTYFYKRYCGHCGEWKNSTDEIAQRCDWCGTKLRTKGLKRSKEYDKEY